MPIIYGIKEEWGGNGPGCLCLSIAKQGYMCHSKRWAEASMVLTWRQCLIAKLNRSEWGSLFL